VYYTRICRRSTTAGFTRHIAYIRVFSQYIIVIKLKYSTSRQIYQNLTVIYSPKIFLHFVYLSQCTREPVANAADELPAESDYQTSALFAFFTDKIFPCVGLGSTEWKEVTLLKILIQVTKRGRETWREDKIVFIFLPMNVVLYLCTWLVVKPFNYLELSTVTQRRKNLFCFVFQEKRS
jgi:hypothetical protein